MGVPDLLKIAKPVLTTSTKWFGPTAPFGSGGAPVTVKLPEGPLKPAPTPSNPRPSAGASAVPALPWTTGSGAPLDGASGMSCFGFSFFLLGSGAGAGAIVPSGGETS